MSVYQIMDAAYPPATVPAGVQGVIGYLASPAALHSWEPREWLPFQHLRQFPMWVAALTGSPTQQAEIAVSQVLSLGWAAHEPAPYTRAIGIDMEASAEPAFYAIMAEIISGAGFAPFAYGSLSTVLGNAADDVLVADWDDTAVIPAGQDIHGGQYLANVPYGSTKVDYSLFDGWLYQRGGRGARRQ
jgi:hypothetical protein